MHHIFCLENQCKSKGTARVAWSGVGGADAKLAQLMADEVWVEELREYCAELVGCEGLCASRHSPQG